MLDIVSSVVQGSLGQGSLINFGYAYISGTAVGDGYSSVGLGITLVLFAIFSSGVEGVLSLSLAALTRPDAVSLQF